MAVRNLRTSQAKKTKDAIRRAETASPLGFSSVTRGAVSIESDEGLLVDGSQRVTGRLHVDGIEYVSGQLRVTGSFIVSGNAEVTGPMRVSGPLDVLGDTTFIGPMEVQGTSTFIGKMTIEGDLDITGHTVITGEFEVKGDVTFTGKTVLNGDTEMNGDTKVSGDVEVTGGGEIVAGTLHLGPSYNGGAGGLYSDQTMFLGAAGTLDLLANSSVDIITGDGVNIRGGGLRVIGMSEVTKDAAGYSAVMVHNSTGQLVRVI
ncbi:hypothetical protein [Frigoribacterium sp. CFBP9030]|uniref:hypothetical protein n=1 Tax=Frigoribacterium sp. CFBP9030 TaxID=3096537 RepID=UPI002A6B3B88|nr:hypothetical protein [Frigoribacterium sp. CFBP9030]MDY0891886.1 hypothetical protein [Frigoribacterium sp. CFBP9030]